MKTMNINEGGVLAKNLIDKLLNAQTDLENKIFELELENEYLKNNANSNNDNNDLTYKNIIKDMLYNATINRELTYYGPEVRLTINDYTLQNDTLNLLQDLFFEVQNECEYKFKKIVK